MRASKVDPLDDVRKAQLVMLEIDKLIGRAHGIETRLKHAGSVADVEAMLLELTAIAGEAAAKLEQIHAIRAGQLERELERVERAPLWLRLLNRLLRRR